MSEVGSPFQVVIVGMPAIDPAGQPQRPPAVEATAVESGSGTSADSRSGAAVIPTDARVRIQVASYSSEANAKATLERLTLSGLHAVIERAGSRFRVAFPDLSPNESRLVTVKLDGLGYRGYTVTTITPIR